MAGCYELNATTDYGAHRQVHAEQSQYKEIVATFAHAQPHTQNEDVKIGMN